MSQYIIDRSIPEPNSGCWLWLGAINNKGYGVTRIKGKTLLAHRESYKRDNGPISNDLCVLHKCDQPSCVNSEHLFLGTNQDNIKDKMKKNRQTKGAENGGKLTEYDVLCIRKDTRTFQVLADIYDVSTATISRVKTNTTYRHI